jgi:hypothetical protein
MTAELQIPAELAPYLDRLVGELRRAAPVDAVYEHEAKEWAR